MPERPQWFEAPGYVQRRLPRLSLSPDDDRVLPCGNPGMIDDRSAVLSDDGFGKSSLVREKYLPGPAPR